MFKQFTYRIKIVISDKALLYWTLLFPMTLALFFNLTLRNAFEIKPLSIMPIAVVNVEDIATNNFLESLENDYSLIEVHSYESKNQAIQDLELGKIDAIVEYDTQIRLTVPSESSVNATVVANVFTSYNQKQAIIKEQLSLDASKVTPEFIESLVNTNDFINAKEDEKLNDVAMINMYTTIAMLCIYASQWGMRSGFYMQADKSKLAIRTNTSPTKKQSIVLMDLCVVYVIFIVELVIHLLFLRFILNVSMGTQPLVLISTGLMGGLLSAAMGYMFSVSFTSSESSLVYLISGIGVLLNFFSGMMSVDVKYFIDSNLPLINKLNPAALITDNFYHSYLGIDFSESLQNIGIMAVLTVIFGVIAFRKLRTVTYDSI